jgi:predicted lipoprotein
MSRPSTSSPARASIPWRWIAPVIAVIAVLVAFPPFHIVPLGSDGKRVRTGGAGVGFDAPKFAEKFWTEKLQPAAGRAGAMAPILEAVRREPLAAAKQHGRKVGEGTTWYFFARGSGRVTAVEKSRLLVEIDGAPGAIVAVRTGPVFGNVVRDGCGLIELNDVPGLTEFNALSAEFNRMVEERVQPALKTGVAPGARLTFAGCAEAPESLGTGPLLVFVPVEVAP